MHVILILIVSLWAIAPNAQSQAIVTTLLKGGVVLERVGTVGTEQIVTTFQVMIPIVPKNGFAPTTCGSDVMTSFLADAKSTLQPFKKVNQIRQSLVTRSKDQKVLGIAIAAGAAAVATGAALTSAIAMDKANKNARNIAQLREAMTETNNAVESLTDATRGLAVVVNDVTNTINNDIIPAINNLNCEVSKVSMRGALSTLFNRWLIIYSPLLEAPLISQSSALLSSTVLGVAIQAGLNEASISDDVMRDAMSGLIDIQLMEYDEGTLSVLLLVMVKSRTAMPGVSAFRVNQLMIPVGEPIIFSKVQLPSYVASTGANWYSVGDTCASDAFGVTCIGSGLAPYNEALEKCIKGDLTSCQWDRALSGSSFVLLVNGVLADCKTLVCQCSSGLNLPNTLTYITKDCDTLTIDGLQVIIDTFDAGYFVANNTVDFGEIPPKNISFIDTSAMDSINQALGDAEKALEAAREALAKVSNGGGMSVETMVAVGCAVTGILVLLTVGVIGCVVARGCPSMPERELQGHDNNAFSNPPIGQVKVMSMEDLAAVTRA